MNDKKNLGYLRRVDLRDVWRSEASDFTPWLAEKIMSLFEVMNPLVRELDRDSNILTVALGK